MKKQNFLLGLALCATIIPLFVGCVESSSGNVFSRSEALSAQEIFYGTVLDIREGVIEGSQSGVGGGAGAVGGTIIGSLFGGGDGHAVGAVVGGIAGGLIGNKIEKNVTTSAAFQITVRLDDGRQMVVVQEKDVILAVGQRVRLIHIPGGASRVQPL